MLRSLTLFALSACTIATASAAINHPDVSISSAKANRVTVKLVNKSFTFRDVKIADHSYTVRPNEVLYVKAPAGTIVYADSTFGKRHRGDTLLELTPSIDHSDIRID